MLADRFQFQKPTKAKPETVILYPIENLVNNSPYGKKEKIKHELEEIWYALLNAKIVFYYAEYLFNPPTSKRKALYQASWS